MNNTIGYAKVKAAAAYSGTKLTQIAEALNLSPSSLTIRMMTGKFSLEEWDTIAKAVGAEFSGKFVFPDGMEI